MQRYCNRCKGFLVLHCLDQLVTQDVALCMLTTSEWFYFFRSMKNDKHIKTTCWKTNAYTLEYVAKEDLYKEDWIEQPPTLVQKIPISGWGMIWENIQLREHDPSIIASWKSLRSGPWRFLYAVSNAIDILVEHFSSLDLEKVGHKRAEAWEKGWWEPDFMFTDQRGLQTKRLIINPERFLYSRANMNLNAIKLLNRDDIQPELRTFEGRVAYHQECLERNKRQKKT